MKTEKKKPEVKTEKPKKMKTMTFLQIFAFARAEAGTGPAAAKCMKAMFAEYKNIEFHEEFGISRGTLVQVCQSRSNSSHDAERARGA